MRVGVILPMAAVDGSAPVPSWPVIRSFAEHAESSGLDSIWVYDHLFSNPPGAEPSGIQESWTVLAALAAVTHRVELGQMVMCASFRHPALLAKMAVTADEVSGGRLLLGIGAGWHDQEYRAFGFPTDHRVSRFEDALEITMPLLRGETLTFHGRFHSVDGAVLLPPPQRRIPVLVASKGPRMLRLTAEHADAWNTAWYGRPDERLRQRCADMDAALAVAGRRSESLRRTVGVIIEDPEASQPAPDSVGFRGGVDELAELLGVYEAMGFADMIVILEPLSEPSLDRLAEAIRRRGGRG